MKTLAGFVVTLFLLAFTFAPRMSGIPLPPPNFTVRLISPTAGQVLYPGQKVRVEWQISIPDPINWPSCEEMELWLSLDGGTTYIMQVSPCMDPRTRFFYWIVPNMPTNAAVLDVRYGCEPFYPDTRNAQTASPFVIANAGGQ